GERAAGGRVLPRGGRAAARERSRRGPGAVGTGDDAAGVSAVDVAGAAGSIVQDARGQALDRRLLKMSELAERSGVSPGTIRYYLREGLLGAGRDIVRTSRNMAYYPPEYVERIALIKRLQQQRFMPLRVIKDALASEPERLHALIELEDRILEQALASAEDGARVSRAAVHK